MNNQADGSANASGPDAAADAPPLDPKALAERISEFIKRNPDFHQILRPEHMTQTLLTSIGLSQAQIKQYQYGVTALWTTLVQVNSADPKYRQAKDKLAQLSSRLKDLLRKQRELEEAKKKERAGHQPAQQQAQPSPINQQGPQNSPKLGQQQSNPQETLPMSMLSEASDQQLQRSLKEELAKIRWNVPSTMEAGSDEAKQWINSIQARWFKTQLDKQRQKHNMSIINMKFEQNKNKEDKEVKQQFDRDRAELKARYDAAELNLQSWSKHILSAPTHANTSNHQPQSGNVPTAPNVQSSRPVPNPSTQQQMSRQQPGQAVNQQTSAMPNFSQRPQTQPMQTPNQRPATQQGQSNTPVALTHQEALARSHNSSQQPPMANNGTIHQDPRQQPTLPNDDPKRVSGQPISKTWQPPLPQPVNMGPARPTLAGANNGPVGPMGQPAIQKPESFLLQGPGDRVLEKRKLDELYRQVCGADAGEGDSLNPEVSESMLQLGDEFVDNVVTSACKLAKLRGGTTLEIRDIQLVLERQYNIRIPGFATDEVRTVRKTQPSAGYYQKMAAVQAAKVMGGKTDT